MWYNVTSYEIAVKTKKDVGKCLQRLFLILIKPIFSECKRGVHYFMKGKKAYKKGFTLMELIAVIAVLATLAALAMPAYMAVKRKMEKKECDQNKYIIWRTFQNEHRLDPGVKLEDVIHDRYLIDADSGTYAEHIFFVETPYCAQDKDHTGYSYGGSGNDEEDLQLDGYSSHIVCPIHG